MIGQLKGIPKASWPVLLIIGGVVALVAFLSGFVPLSIKTNTAREELKSLRFQNEIAHLQNTLGSAAINARRAQYEVARQFTSRFYTVLLASLEKEGHPTFAVAQRQKLQPLLAQRDDLITLLARSDPVSAERLSDLYVEFVKALDLGSENGG